MKAIQVDGGSEFMAVSGLDPEIEAACQARGIALYVLPRSPQMNGAVERCNGAWRSEFYETYDLPDSVNEPRSSKATSTSTITIGPMARLPEKPQPSISRTAQPRDLSRLICAEPDSLFPSRLLRPIFRALSARAAMAINGHRNKSFGPGGGTRRLHPSPFRRAGFGGGEIGSTGDPKDDLSPGMIPPLSGQTYRCE